MSTNTPGPWAYGKALLLAGGLMGATGICERIAHPARPAHADLPRTAVQPSAEEGKANLRQGLVRLHHSSGQTTISI